jgi:hypothetical protein
MMSDQKIFDNWAEAVIYDRKIRKTMTRVEYANLVDLTPSLIQGAENGRRMKPATMEALLPLVGDLLPVSLGGKVGEQPQEPAETPSPVESIDSLSDHERARVWLQSRYSRVMERLKNKPAPPFGLPGSGGTPDTCMASEFQAWAAWLDQVEAHLGPDTEIEQSFVPVWLFDDEDEDDQDHEVLVLDPEPILGDLEVQLAQSIELARNGAAPVDPVAAPRMGDVIEGPWQQLDPPQRGRRLPDRLTLDPAMRYVTNGELQTWSDCRRRWWLEYYLKVASGPRSVTGAAALGTRVHAALAVFYVPEGEDAGDPFAELEWSLADDRRYLESVNAPPARVKELEAEHEFAKIIVEGYLEWLQETGADRDYQVISTEHGLAVNPGFPGLENVRILSKEDSRFFRGIDGAVLFIDHKVVQSFEQLSGWATLNRQFIHYGLIEFLMLAEKQSADIGSIEEREIKRTDGAILNMLRKVKRSATAKPPYYHRHLIRYNTETFRSYWRQILGTVREITATIERLDNGADHQEHCPPRPTSDCSWKCQFFAVCSSFDDGSDAKRLVAETMVSVNPLERYDPDLAKFVQ